MGPIKMHALTNLPFVTHPYKQSNKCGIHHMPEARQVKPPGVFHNKAVLLQALQYSQNE